MQNERIKSKVRFHAKILRHIRLLHRTTGVLLAILLLFIGISGFMLGWKKHCNGYLLPNTQQGTTSEFSQWQSMQNLHSKALKILADSVSEKLSPELSRIDIRKQAGVVKFVFETHFWEIQLDGATGNLLSIAKRRSDLLEQIHDGSFLDNYFKTNNEPIKRIYTSIMGISLILFSISGFWIWIMPVVLKKIVKKQSQKSDRKTH